MGSITFLEHNGAKHIVEIESGKSLMQTALDGGIPGIDGDCGGECACGTCHLIVEVGYINIVGSASGEELQMLELTPDRTDNSRLACQVIASDDMDGMIVQLPEFQM
ncbi:2Fe-2S iron-sulfur cluster-binding protein [Zhongshania sp.]|uniref:2Fe-2S iron-sulfur cluster-binding protein n=1 Tax=Zhongshania sp. TaxID=1971902 RepID=UPI003562F9D4